MNNKTVVLSDGRSVEMRCPTVLMMKLALKKRDDFEQAISLIAGTCNIAPQEVEALSMPDFIMLQGELSGFLGQQD